MSSRRVIRHLALPPAMVTTVAVGGAGLAGLLAGQQALMNDQSAPHAGDVTAKLESAVREFAAAAARGEGYGGQILAAAAWDVLKRIWADRSSRTVDGNPTEEPSFQKLREAVVEAANAHTAADAAKILRAADADGLNYDELIIRLEAATHVCRLQQLGYAVTLVPSATAWRFLEG